MAYVKTRHRIKKRRINYKLNEASVLFTNAELQEYLEVEAEACINNYLKQYTKNERLVIFLVLKLGWGRKKIRNLAGLSEAFTRKTLYDVADKNYRRLIDKTLLKTNKTIPLNENFYK